MSTQSTVTEKRTVITSSSSGGVQQHHDGDDADDFYYKSAIHPRRSDIGHSSSGSHSSYGGSGGSVKRTVEISAGMLPQGYSNVSHTGVVNVKSHREQEKKDMQNLNERFASYIEKVRFLEAQNRKLTSELEHMRSNWGKETGAIKKMYETELEEARKMIEEINKEKDKMNVRMQSMQDQLSDAMRQ